MRRLPLDRARRRPDLVHGGQDLADDDLDDAVQDRILVGDVVVERHRLDAELVGEVAHRQRVDAARVGEFDGRAQHPLPGQGHTALLGGIGLGGHARDIVRAAAGASKSCGGGPKPGRTSRAWYWRGVMPRLRRKWRCRWLWSAKPVAAARVRDRLAGFEHRLRVADAVGDLERVGWQTGRSRNSRTRRNLPMPAAAASSRGRRCARAGRPGSRRPSAAPGRRGD